MKKVLVLMATYNGAQYLDEQIQSLIDQKNVELEILVRDDGSTDNTTNVLNKWKKQGKREKQRKSPRKKWSIPLFFRMQQRPVSSLRCWQLEMVFTGIIKKYRTEV